MMRATVWQHLDLAARKLTPFLMTVGLVVLNLVPLHIPGYAPVAPDFALMAVYYWALHRPTLLPIFAVFVIGLMQDFLSGGPIGLSAAILILVYVIAVSQTRFFYGKSFLVVWWGFMVVATGASLVEWAASCLLAGALIAPEPAVFECAMNIATYPLFGWLFVQVHRTLPREE